MPSTAQANPLSSTASYASTSPVNQQHIAGLNQVASVTSPTTVSSQVGMVALTPSEDLGSLRLKDSMSFSVMLGVIVVSFVLLRHVIGRVRQSPLQHLT